MKEEEKEKLFVFEMHERTEIPEQRLRMIYRKEQDPSPEEVKKLGNALMEIRDENFQFTKTENSPE